MSTLPTPSLNPALPSYYPALIARQFLYVREAQQIGQNRGLRVEAIQHWTGGRPGDSWCAEFAWMVVDICYQGNAPIPRTGSCEAIRIHAKKRGMIVDTPAVNCLVLFLDGNGTARHIGVVSSLDPLMHISGNTSAPDVEDSFNGDRVAEKIVRAHAGGSLVFVDVTKGQ